MLKQLNQCNEILTKKYKIPQNFMLLPQESLV